MFRCVNNLQKIVIYHLLKTAYVYECFWANIYLALILKNKVLEGEKTVDSMHQRNESRKTNYQLFLLKAKNPEMANSDKYYC